MAEKETNRGSDLQASLLSSSALQPPSPAQRLAIDDMLRLHAGEFGRWQLRHFVLTTLAWALEAFHTMVMIFADREPAWRCRFAGDCPPEQCGIPAGAWEWVEGSAASTVSEWGLICGQRYKIGLSQSAFFAGCMVGAGIFGHLSDSFLGRKGSLTIVCILNAITGILTSFSPTYWFYTAFRFLNGFGTGGVGLCAFVLATEPIGPSKRGVAGMSTFYFFSTGIAILSGVAYLFRTWRTLFVVTSLPSLLFVLLIIPFISESPRWYLIRRQTSKAMNLMRAIARCNGREISPEVTLKLDDEDDEQNSKESAQAESGSIIDVLRSRRTRLRLILMICINFMCAVVYYGLTLNVVNLKTNLYLSVTLNSVAEMPAYVITAVLLDRLGRKPLGIGTMLLSGVFCLIGFFIGGAGMMMKTLRMVCGVIGIFGMAAMYNLLFIYTAELFPTVVRNAALGCVTQASQLGAILAPLVVVAGQSLPFAVFGACGIAGALLTCFLPETMNKPLYDTMVGLEGGERNFVR
ncbi:organic cation/carnitine transporter 4-like isoform X2 [Phalaenopsis equestris]|uniref:organic cation/carnitine transporter 4-like isoform X2 n=1 Tax=Phalaenopsis equestris TaxID=78828 RepID=UPI0009E42CA1|nr:organic cation/carnitine transporter 4-like isoform X2 [Phalaenopsis equestris]